MKRRSSWVAVAVLCVMAFSGCGTPGGGRVDMAPPPISSGPLPPEANRLLQQADQLQKSGNTQQAIPIWERLAQSYPDNVVAARAFYELGRIYLTQGQPDRALQFFDYLLYTYPGWEGISRAQLERLRALAAAGKKKQAQKEAATLWTTSAGQPEVQLGLSRLMAEIYGGEGDTETAFDWLSAGMPVATTPADKQALAQSTIDLLKNADESTLKRLLKKNPPEFMRVFVEYRMAQIAMERNPSQEVKDRLRALAAQNPNHPVVPEIQAALRGSPGEVTLPLNSDRIGCLLPLNGSYAKYGQMVMRGFGLAKEDWTERYPGDRADLSARDAQTDPDQAIKAFEELARDEGVLGIIGPLGSQAAKAVTPVAGKWGVPLLALTQKEEDAGDNSFVVHLFLDNRDLVRTLVKYCREKLGYTRFAALYPDDRYGQKLSKIFAEVVREEGGNVLASIPYKEKSTDFKDPIQKLMTMAKQNVPPSGVDTTPFEALFIPDQVQTVSLIAPQLPYNNVIGATLLGTNLWGEGPLVQTGGAYVEQALFATPYYGESSSPRVKEFREKYQALYHTVPSYLEAQAYDALMLFLQARAGVRGAASGGRAAFLQNLLRTRGYQGVAGTYSFSPDGRLQRDYLLLQVQNGQLIQLSR